MRSSQTPITPRPGVAVLFLAAVAAVPCAAAHSAPGQPELPEPRADLVRDLGSEDYRVRERAAAALEACGPEVLPDLEAALTVEDPEVRRRAAQLVDLLRRRRLATTMLEPRRYRLVCRDLTLAEAAEQFAQVTGCRIHLDARSALRHVTLDTGQVSFWEALDQFCRATGLGEKAWQSGPSVPAAPWAPHQAAVRAQLGLVTPTHLPAGPPPTALRAVTLGPGPTAGPTFLAGAVRLRLLPASPGPGPWDATRGEYETIRVLQVLGDPDLGGLRVLSLRLTRAVDDRGDDWELPEAFLNDRPPQAPLEDWMLGRHGGDNPAGVTVPVRLRSGRPGQGRAQELHGVLVCRVLGRRRTVAAVDDVLAAVGSPVPGVEGAELRVLRAAAAADGSHDMIVRLRPPWEDRGDWQGAGLRRWVWGGWRPPEDSADMPDLQAVDPAGHSLPLTLERTDEGGGEPELRLRVVRAPAAKGPVRLVWVGRAAVTLEVPFVLRDGSPP